MSLTIFTPPLSNAINDSEAEGIFKQHGVTIEKHADHAKFIFPEGTKREYRLRITRTERYEITLPDGWKISQLEQDNKSIFCFAIPNGA